jgi:hypothetical protein
LCEIGGDSGYISVVNYRIRSNFNEVVQNVWAHEAFGNKVSCEANNWSLPTAVKRFIPAGKPGKPGELLTDEICVTSWWPFRNLNPAPLIPQFPLRIELVDYIPQQIYIGSEIERGINVQNHIQTRYIDHGEHMFGPPPCP